MGFQFELTRQWRDRNENIVHPGVYRVPRDFSEGIAQQMLDAGAAVKVGRAHRAGLETDQLRRAIGDAVDSNFGLVRADQRFAGQTVVVAAPGPSLSEAIADKIQRWGGPAVAVNDAYQLLPFAHLVYACDSTWWKVRGGAPEFAGEKWSSHTIDAKNQHNDKRPAALAYNLQVIEGRCASNFSADPACIHYGDNSGFQAVNLALLMGARVVLVGFDMREVRGNLHFFGNHVPPLRNPSNFAGFIAAFEQAARAMPEGFEVLNATRGSALKCFPKVKLDDVLSA